MPETGLVMIQIDGLSRPQLERALAEGRMPYLRRLAGDGGYGLHSLYSGLPSCTPASQGELFYGVKNAVPSFAFLEQDSGKIVKMFSQGTATAIQKELASRGQSLLSGGSSYSNIYDGGALRSSYCACQMGFKAILARPGSLGILPLVFGHPLRLMRILGLMALEAAHAAKAAVRAVARGALWSREAVFFVNRIFGSVCLREVITVLAIRDIRQGLPIVHVNYIGYDEHAHQRGPASASASGHLRKIDGAIARLAAAIAKSRKRRYQSWIYSDHGQESVRPYREVAETTLEESLRDISGAASVIRIPDPHPLSSRHREGKGLPENIWLVSNPGPLVSVYPSRPLAPAEKEAISESLVRDARLPAVFHVSSSGRVRACTAEGWFELPEGGPAILGPGHPFPEECIEDLMALCRHPLAGPLIVSGWNGRGASLSFFSESGSHGGIGREEVHGFLLLPLRVSVPARKPYLRFLDLREMVLKERLTSG